MKCRKCTTRTCVKIKKVYNCFLIINYLCGTLVYLLGWVSVANSCEVGSESLVSMKGGEYFDKLNDSELHRKGSVLFSE
jgi:hypothetical protein